MYIYISSSDDLNGSYCTYIYIQIILGSSFECHFQPKMAFFFLRKKSLGQRDALVVENVRAIVGGSHLICLISQCPGGAVM
jgi:hypothetical protein